MASAASNLVNKVWNYCHLLRDDGVSYGDYVEQLTYLLFLKMDYERTRPPYRRKSTIPEHYNWASLIELDGLPLERHYRNTLENLGKEPDILGIIFKKAQNKIQNPAHLRRLIVDLIDKEPWSALSADVKGDSYEGLLEKNAQDTKSGAGQYFTPRVLIDAIVEVMRPQPGTAIIPPRAPVVFSSPRPATSASTTSLTATRYATCKPRRSTPSNSWLLPRASAP